MIITDAPAWLRRSDQAVTWARTMLQRAGRRATGTGAATSDVPPAPTARRRHRLRDNRSAGRRYWQRRLSEPAE